MTTPRELLTADEAPPPIQLIRNGKQLKLKCGERETAQRTLDPEEIAYLDTLENGTNTDTSSKELFAILRRCYPPPEELPGERPTKWYELPR